MNYVYVKSEPGLWTVGFYLPDGSWEPESDHHSENEAAQRTAYLNGSYVKKDKSSVFTSFTYLPEDELYEALQEAKERGDLRLVGMISRGVYSYIDTSTGKVYVVDEWWYKEFK